VCQGHTIDEALANLAEAVELYLEEVDDPARKALAPLQADGLTVTPGWGVLRAS
jgi:predicted RNase H-like HicB family nuclease